MSFFREVVIVASVFGMLLVLSDADASDKFDVFGTVEETNPTSVEVDSISNYQTRYRCNWQFDTLTIIEKDYRRTDEEKEILLNRDDACILLRRIIRNTDW